MSRLCFFYNDTPAPDCYTLSLHDALPIFVVQIRAEDQRVDEKADQSFDVGVVAVRDRRADAEVFLVDRKSTRLNSSHVSISYAVFCLKKKSSNVLLDKSDGASRTNEDGMT